MSPETRRVIRWLVASAVVVVALGGLWFVLTLDHAPDFWGEWLPRAMLTGAAVGLVLPSLSGAAVANLPRQDFAVGGVIN